MFKQFFYCSQTFFKQPNPFLEALFLLKKNISTVVNTSFASFPTPQMPGYFAKAYFISFENCDRLSSFLFPNLIGYLNLLSKLG